MMDSNRTALMKLAEQKKVRVELSLEILEIQDQGGKPYVIFKDSERLPAQTFDKVVFAIGGTTPLNFLKTAGVDCENNWPKHSETGATNIPGLYLTGDLVAGKLGGSIISAYNSVYRTVGDFFPRLK
jgi:thioredoxin reductase (NADPH)